MEQAASKIKRNLVITEIDRTTGQWQVEEIDSKDGWHSVRSGAPLEQILLEIALGLSGRYDTVRTCHEAVLVRREWLSQVIIDMVARNVSYEDRAAQGIC